LGRANIHYHYQHGGRVARCGVKPAPEPGAVISIVGNVGGKGSGSAALQMRANMARVPLTFRQRDVVAAVKAVSKAGHQIARVEISKDGRIAVVIARAGTEPGAVVATSNEWDVVLP
jgi:hypothetical protein